MPLILLPPLPLAEWLPTRRTLHAYTQVLGAIRAALAPHQKQSFHRSLRLAAVGPTTTPLPFGRLTADVVLDLTQHQVVVTTSRGDTWRQALHGQTQAEFCQQVLSGLDSVGVPAELDRQPLSASEPGAYDVPAVERFWSALSQIDQILKRFRGELREETGAVQLWPHGFDLALLWFSGRRVPGQDPARPPRADEQMNFGFSTGDAGLPEPYFYATAYPLPAALPAMALPPEVYWHSQGWNGAVLPYARLVDTPDAEDRLLGYWRAVHQAGARLMLGTPAA
jgi:hypothetical protein